jgi:hypothetical protein
MKFELLIASMYFIDNKHFVFFFELPEIVKLVPS